MIVNPPQIKPLDYYLSPQQFFDPEQALLSEKAFLESENSTNTTEYQASLFSTGFISLHRQNRLDEVIPLAESTLDPLEQNLEPPFTMTLLTEIISKKLVFETAKELKRFHELTTEVINQIKQETLLSESLFLNSAEPHTFSAPFVSKQVNEFYEIPCAAEVAVKLHGTTDEMVLSQIDRIIGGFVYPFANVSGLFRLFKEYDIPPLPPGETAEERERAQALEFLKHSKKPDFVARQYVNHGSGLAESFDNEILIARALFEVDKSQRFVGCFKATQARFNDLVANAIDIFVFHAELCIEGKGEERSLYRLILKAETIKETELESDNIVKINQNIKFQFETVLEQTTFLYTLRDMINLLNKRFPASVEVPQEFDANSCGSNCFPAYFVQPSPIVKIWAWLSGYIEIIEEKAEENDLLVIEQIGAVGILEHIQKTSAKALACTELSGDNAIYSVPISTEIGIPTRNLRVEDVKSVHVNCSGVYFAVFTGEWLFLYENHADLLPVRAYYLDECFAIIGDQLARVRGSIALCTLSGSDILFRLLPRVAYNSNDFSEAYNPTQIGEMSVYKWVQLINQKCSQKVDNNIQEMFFTSHSFVKNASIKDLVQVIQQVEDAQLLFISACNIIDQISAFKSYPCTIYFMSEIFYLAYKQDDRIVKRKLRYDDIQDIKELKQNAIEIIVEDQAFAFKFRQVDRDHFLKIIVDLWQASQALEPTSLQECIPSYAGIHNNEKSGYVLMREENGTWNHYYMSLINKQLFFFKDPLDVQPEFYFPLTGSSCVNFDQQLQNHVASASQSGSIGIRFDENKGEFEFRNYVNSTSTMAVITQQSEEYDILGSNPADYYSVISGETFNNKKLEITRVANFTAWTRSFETFLDINSCIQQLSLRLQGEMPKAENYTASELEELYIQSLSDSSQYSNESAVNFAQFIQEFEKLQKASPPLGQLSEPLQDIEYEQYSDQTVFPLASAFAVVHHKKFLVLSAFSANDRDDWLSVIEYYSPENLPEVSSCLEDLAEITNIDENNFLEQEIQDYNVKLNDGVVLYQPNKFLLTRTTIFDIQKNEFLLLRNIKEYKITRFGTVKLLNLNQKQLEIDFGNLESVKLFLDAVEIMRYSIIPSEFMFTTETGLIDVAKLQACLDAINAPRLDQELEVYYMTGLKPDKYIMQSKPLEHEIIRFYTYLHNQQRASSDSIDSSNFDELRQSIAVNLSESMIMSSRAGLNFNYLSLFFKGENVEFSPKYTRFVAPRPAYAQYCLRIPSEFLKRPRQLNLVPVYIVCFAQQVLVFDTKYASEPEEIIMLKDCIAHSSDNLLSGFITSRQEVGGDVLDYNAMHGQQAFDFGRAEQRGGTLGREAREMIRSVEFSMRPLNFFRNTVGLYFLNSQSHFFAFVSEDLAYRFASVVELQVPEMSAASYDQLKELAVSAQNQEFLLSVNTLFAEFKLQADEILIRRAKFESLSPSDGEIPGGTVGTVDQCFSEKQLGDFYLTTHHICIRFISDVKNQKGLKIAISTADILRISPSASGLTIVYRHQTNEGRVQINGLEAPLELARLAIDMYEHEKGKTAPSLLSNQPTAFAALYACQKLLGKADCLLFYENRFISVQISLISVRDRLTKAGKPALTSLQFHRQIGDSEPIDLFKMKNIVLDLNKQQFLQDVIKDITNFQNHLLIFQNRRGKVVYAILRFENSEMCQIWAEMIRTQAGEISQQKLEIIKQFSGTGKRLAIQEEVQETFSEHELHFPDKQLFLSKYNAIMSAKIAGCPVIEDFTEKMSDTASLKLQEKLISEEEDQINLFEVNNQPIPEYCLPQDEIFLEPPSLTSAPIGQLYLLSDCLGFASEKQIEIIKYQHINSISTGVSVFNFESLTIEQTIQQFPELYKMPNTIIISCRRPAKVYAFEAGENVNYFADEAEVKYDNISDSEGDENRQLEVENEWEELTLQFVLTPTHPQEDESLISALSSAALEKVKIEFVQAEKSEFELNADKLDIGRREQQVTINVLRIASELMDLCYEKRQIIPPSLFTNSPSLLSLAHSQKVLSASILSNDLAQGWIRCFLFLKFDLLFVVEARETEFTDELQPFDLNIVSTDKLSERQYQITKIIDLRRASIMDGKFLTSTEGTVSVVGSKMNEYTIRLFEDDFLQYLSNPLYVCVPNGENDAEYAFISNEYKLNHEQYMKFMNTKLQVVPHQQIRLDLDYLRPYQVLADSVTALSQKTQLLLSNLSENQARRQELEYFEPDTLAILKLDSTEEQQDLIQHVMDITQKYPASPNIKELTKKLSAASEQLEGNEDWQLLRLAESPVAIFRCGLQTAKVSIPGKIMLGRVHLLFIGQVLGSKIYLIRRLSAFTAPPEFSAGQMTLRGGLIDGQEVKFEYNYIESKIEDINEAFRGEIRRLIDNSRKAEEYIEQLTTINFNSEPTVAFENVSHDLKQMVLDLTEISLNITPASLMQSIPSTAACWPRLAFEPIYIYESSTSQFVRFYIAIFGERGYIFETAQSAQPVTSFTLFNIECDRIFVDEELFEVEDGKIIKCIKQNRGDENPDENSDSDSYSREDFVNSIAIYQKMIVRDARQVLRLRMSSNEELDNFVDSEFDFDDSMDSFSDSEDKPPAELFIAADSTGALQKVKCAIELGSAAAKAFQATLQSKELKLVENCERGAVSMHFNARDEILKKCEIGICELTRIELTKNKKGGVVGAGIYFKKGKRIDLIQHCEIVDCWIDQKGFSKRGQRICLVYKRHGGQETRRLIVLECEMQLCREFVKQICALIWWEQHNGIRK